MQRLALAVGALAATASAWQLWASRGPCSAPRRSCTRATSRSAVLLGLTISCHTEYTNGIDLTFLGMPACNLYTSLDVRAACGGATRIPGA
jgi:hypothetical protein